MGHGTDQEHEELSAESQRLESPSSPSFNASSQQPQPMETTSLDSLSDEQLVQRAREGSLEAFEALMARYEDRIYQLAVRILNDLHEAEDVTQQTFLNALEHLDSFRGDSSFAGWLFRIATNAALKVLRKRRGLDTIRWEEETREEDGYETLASFKPTRIAPWQRSPEELVQNRELLELLEKALAELDEKHRIVFLLRDVEGLSVKETAEALGISEANVKVRLLRARLQLRERLSEWLETPHFA